MAVLPDGERFEVWADLMRGAFCPGSLTKSQFRAAVDSADNWLNANASSFNSALPAAARTAMTPAQKARLLAALALRRYDADV